MDGAVGNPAGKVPLHGHRVVVPREDDQRSVADVAEQRALAGGARAINEVLAFPLERA